jgi:DNA-binding Lrp family transcriptional regulator
MTQKIDLPVEELTRLYVDERMTLPEIAERFGTTQWTIGNRLRDAGVQKRSRGSRPSLVDPEELERLYRTGVPVTELAKRFGRSQPWISKTLKARGITNLQGKTHRMKHPELRGLAVGEHIDVPGSQAERDLYAVFYMMAKKAGIRVSVTTLDERTIRVTRIGTPPRRNLGSNIPVEEMIKLRRVGATLTEIARRAGLTRKGVKYHLEKAGVD